MTNGGTAMAEKTTDLASLLDGLREVDQQLHTTETDLKDRIRQARTEGATWAQIGEALGTTRQAAWERFKRVVEN